jgi:hypothetical protein
MVYKIFSIHLVHLLVCTMKCTRCTVHKNSRFIFYNLHCITRPTTYILNTEEFTTALLHVENVKQLFGTTVCS